MHISRTWAEFKTQLANGLPFKYWSQDSSYYIYAVDGPFQFFCRIQQNGNEDQADFEANYKNSAYSTFSQFDTDGAAIVRTKAAKRGWSFWAVPIEMTTSTLGGSVYCKDSAGNDIAGITCKIYDANNDEITVAGIGGINLTQCVKTVLDFEPAFDFEMIGGALRINSNPASDIRLWVIGAPDIPAMYGGSKEFASGINLKFMAPDSSFEIDGRVTKYVTYSASTHSGKIRILLKHPAGTQVNMQFVIHTYRL
jgi:hypothetical protein